MTEAQPYFWFKGFRPGRPTMGDALDNRCFYLRRHIRCSAGHAYENDAYYVKENICVHPERPCDCPRDSFKGFLVWGDKPDMGTAILTARGIPRARLMGTSDNVYIIDSARCRECMSERRVTSWNVVESVEYDEDPNGKSVSSPVSEEKPNRRMSETSIIRLETNRSPPKRRPLWNDGIGRGDKVLKH